MAKCYKVSKSFYVKADTPFGAMKEKDGIPGTKSITPVSEEEYDYWCKCKKEGN
jgi:hypothetical protein